VNKKSRFALAMPGPKGGTMKTTNLIRKWNEEKKVKSYLRS